MPDVPERDVTRSEEADNARPRAFTEAPRRPASCGRTENHLAHSYGEHRWCTGASPYDLTEAASELHEAPAADPEAPVDVDAVAAHAMDVYARQHGTTVAGLVSAAAAPVFYTCGEHGHFLVRNPDPENGPHCPKCFGVLEPVEAREVITDLVFRAPNYKVAADAVTNRVVLPILRTLAESSGAPVPATPPGRSADEIRAAIADTIDADPDHSFMVDDLMANVVGPLIAERDGAIEARDAARQISRGRTMDQYDDLERAQRAERERDEQRQRAEKWQQAWNEKSAEYARQGTRLVEYRQRAERAEADRDALFEQNGQLQTDLAVATRTVAERDATIADLEGQAARLATAKDTFADELAKAQEASVADAEIIGRLREADARVRERIEFWAARFDGGLMSDVIEEFRTALDGSEEELGSFRKTPRPQDMDRLADELHDARQALARVRAVRAEWDTDPYNCGQMNAPALARRIDAALDGTDGTEAPARPSIVCLCGSTRFYDEFQQANYELTMQGKIVLSVGFYPHAKAQHGHGEGVGHDSAEKVALDELHKRKIDLADYVYVLNVGGYIGESTRGEIDYARAHGKPVRFLDGTDRLCQCETASDLGASPERTGTEIAHVHPDCPVHGDEPIGQGDGYDLYMEDLRPRGMDGGETGE